MRIRFRNADLQAAAAVAQSVANAQSTLPILSNVLINTDHNNLVTLLATDFETRVRIEVPAEVEKKGPVTLPAKTLFDIVKELPESEEIILEQSKDSVTLSTSSLKAQLRTLPARDFPRLDEMETQSAFDLDQKMLKSLISRVLVAVPSRDPRKFLLGSLFEIKKGILSAVATDGKILALARIPHEIEPTPADATAIVPHKLLEELLRNLGDDGLVSVSIEEKQIGFRLNNITYISNQIEGSYPNYEAVIPKEFSKSINFSGPDLLTALRRTAVFSDSRNNATNISFSGNTVTTEAEHHDKGRISDKFTVSGENEDFSITFNYKYVVDALKALESDDITLKANSPALPVVFERTGDNTGFYVVMPIKLTESRDVQPEDDEGANGDFESEDTEEA